MRIRPCFRWPIARAVYNTALSVAEWFCSEKHNGWHCITSRNICWQNDTRYSAWLHVSCALWSWLVNVHLLCCEIKCYSVLSELKYPFCRHTVHLRSVFSDSHPSKSTFCWDLSLSSACFESKPSFPVWDLSPCLSPGGWVWGQVFCCPSLSPSKKRCGNGFPALIL